MKKLMIAAAMVAMGVVANAASVTWLHTGDVLGDGADGDLVGGGQSAYLIQATAHGQEAFLAAFVAAGGVDSFESTVAGWAMHNGAVNAQGKLSVTGGTTSALTGGNAETAYFAIFNGDNVFISTVKNASGYDSINNVYTFDFNAGGDYDTADASYEPVMDAAGGLQGDYDGAGWYSAATPTPEPTSGLLLLLGVAGLALRRRRA